MSNPHLPMGTVDWVWTQSICAQFQTNNVNVMGWHSAKEKGLTNDRHWCCQDWQLWTVQSFCKHIDVFCDCLHCRLLWHACFINKNYANWQDNLTKSSTTSRSMLLICSSICERFGEEQNVKFNCSSCWTSKLWTLPMLWLSKCSVFWVLFEMWWTIWMSNVVIGARCNDCWISWSNETSAKTAFPCFTRLLFVLDLQCDLQCFCLETVHTLHNNQVGRQSCVKMNNVFGDHCDSRNHLRSQHAKAKVWTSFLQIPLFSFAFGLQTSKREKEKGKTSMSWNTFLFAFSSSLVTTQDRNACNKRFHEHHGATTGPWCHVTASAAFIDNTTFSKMLRKPPKSCKNISMLSWPILVLLPAWTQLVVQWDFDFKQSQNWLMTTFCKP